MRRALISVLLFGLCIAGRATDEIAERVGKDCEFCHSDGEVLNETGQAFRRALFPDRPEKTPGAERPATGRVVKGAMRYIHILAAFFWFGTILYVHIVLKPQYAVGGLPRGEVLVGLVCMAAVGITGAVLTVSRIPEAAALLNTRFGLFLLAKMSLFLVMVVSALFAVFFIGPRLKRKGSLKGGGLTPAGLTLDELLVYDGSDGNETCFAYKDEIYEISGSRLWKNGMHAGKHHAGTDLTDALAFAPHGDEVFAKARKVGPVRASAKSSMPWYVKTFFFVAYMNLGIVLLVLLILALW